MEYRLNLEAAQQKAEAKNTVLPKLQDRFELALAQGKILSLAEALDETGLLRAISA